MSVVIPAIPKEKTIGKIIRDLKSASSYSIEIIVVDGHSNDGLKELLILKM